jgi:hypothetical protein
MNDFKKNYCADGAPSAEPVQFFNKMRVTIFSDCYSAFVQVRNWALFMFMVIIFARPSEVCYYCPTVNNIEIPDESLWDKDGYPPYIKIGLHHWKGKKLKEVYYVTIHRNFVNPDFCPVFAILSWLYVSEIKEGPLFPSFTKHKSEKRIIKGPYSKVKVNGAFQWYGFSDTGELKNLSMGYQYLWLMLDELFIRAGYSDARPYTIRKTSTKWAARTGGREFELRLTGRWQQWSEHFNKYIQEGLSEGREHKLTNNKPCFSRLLLYARRAPLTLTSFTYILSSLALCNLDSENLFVHLAFFITSKKNWLPNRLTRLRTSGFILSFKEMPFESRSISSSSFSSSSSTSGSISNSSLVSSIAKMYISVLL